MNLYTLSPSNTVRVINEANYLQSSTSPSCHIWPLNYPLPSVSPSFHMWRQSGLRPFTVCCARELTKSGDQVAQYNAPTHQLPIGTRNETSYDSVGYPLSRSVAPTPSQGQVDAQPNELPSSIIQCPVCKNKFRRVQERNRHLESYLPHSIHCPSQDCHWTGRRQSYFKEHWEKAHSKTDKAPGKELNLIYDPKEFVKLIVNGKSPVEEVARSTFLMVRARLMELGKGDAVDKVWGRNKK